MQIGGKAYADSIDLGFEELLIIRVTADARGQISKTV
jgi:hypothetical protein